MQLKEQSFKYKYCGFWHHERLQV